MNIPFEWIGLATGLMGMTFNARQNILCWPVWLVSNVVWIIHWISKGEQAAILLAIIAIVMNIYGWYEWNKLKWKKI